MESGQCPARREDRWWSSSSTHQVVQTSRDEVENRLVVRRPLTAAEEAYIVGAASQGLGGEHRVRLAYRSEIPRQASGKFAELANETGKTPD